MPEFKYCQFDDECDPDACYYWFSDTYDPEQAMPGEECIPYDPCEQWNYTDPFNPGASRYYRCCNISGKYACENILDCPGESTPDPETGACCYPPGDPRWCQRRLREACDGKVQGEGVSCSTYDENSKTWDHACPVDWEYGACCRNAGSSEGTCTYTYKSTCQETGGDFRGGSCLDTNCKCDCGDTTCEPFWEGGDCVFPNCCVNVSVDCEEGSLQCVKCLPCPCTTEDWCICPDNLDDWPSAQCKTSLWNCPEAGGLSGGLCFGECCQGGSPPA